MDALETLTFVFDLLRIGRGEVRQAHAAVVEQLTVCLVVLCATQSVEVAHSVACVRGLFFRKSISKIALYK